MGEWRHGEWRRGVQSHSSADDDPRMTTSRPPRDAGNTSDLGLTTALLVVGLVLAWATLKYGWFGVTPIEPTPDKTAPSSVGTTR